LQNILQGFYSAYSKGVEYSNFLLNIDKNALCLCQRISKNEVCVNGDSYRLSFSLKLGLLLGVLLTCGCRPLCPRFAGTLWTGGRVSPTVVLDTLTKGLCPLLEC